MKPIHYLLIVAALLSIVKVISYVATDHDQDHVSGETPENVSQVMTPERMLAIIQTADPETKVDGNTVSFQYQDVELTLIFDPRADCNPPRGLSA